MFKVGVKRTDMLPNFFGTRSAWYISCDICGRFLMNSAWTHLEAIDYAHTHIKSHSDRLEDTFK